jgi:hypothetical protein
VIATRPAHHPKRNDDRDLLGDAHLDVLDPAEPGNDVDAEASRADRFDIADRLLQQVRWHCSNAQYSHSAGLAHRPYQGRSSNERHARVNEWNLHSVLLRDACF